MWRNQPASPTYVTYARLRAEGMTRLQITGAVKAGGLIRVRRGRYVPGDTDEQMLLAARLGGRIDCVSLLHRLGIFVLSHDRLHLQLTNGDSRLPRRPSGVTAHWRSSSAGREDLLSDLLEAIVQACRCQPVRMAIATLDSAWHLGVIDEADLAEVVSRLPRRYRTIRRLLDRRSESGPETLVRLMLRSLGCRIEVQPHIRGVGRVDFVVDGWLIVECDSKGFHGSWEEKRRDHRRDMVSAAAGFLTLRLLAEDILYRPETVMAALHGVLTACNSAGPRRRR